MTATQKPPHRANGRGHDTEGVTSMRDKTSAARLKHCHRCGSDLPATFEFWIPRDDRPGQFQDGGCRSCRQHREPKTCRECGESFTPDKHTNTTRTVFFCSNVCSSRARARKPERIAWKKRYEMEYRARPEVSERGRQNAARWRRENAERLYEYKLSAHMKWKYGLTQEEYHDILSEQEGRCAICGTEDTYPHPRLSIDHCHETGRVRGLLCHYCNIAIGGFKDDPARLRAAIDYLERAR